MSILRLWTRFMGRSGTVLALSVFCLFAPTIADAQGTTPRSGSESGGAASRHTWEDQTYKDLKAIHIFVCETVAAGPLPSWLSPAALVKDTRDYIARGSQGITFKDGLAHEPDVRECRYDPVLDEPGNLNFIIKVNIYLAHLHSSEPYPLATVERFIYRPDHRTSIDAFLNGAPVPIDLTDKEAQLNFDLHRHSWWTGHSEQPEFNKAVPIGLHLSENNRDTNGSRLINAKQTISEPNSLDESCKELSKQGMYHYEVVSGTVVRAHKMMPPGDCFSSGECTKWWNAQNARFVVEMKPLSSTSETPYDTPREDFIAITKDENAGTLAYKTPYMTVGANYEFCARYIPDASSTAKSLKQYRIDVVDSIRELK